jgi:lysophospholipase L1-like esterase
VSLFADRMMGEINFSTTVHCQASGGTGSYVYTWSGTKSDIDSFGGCADTSCPILLTTLGNHTITCSVVSGDTNSSVSIILQVTKRARQISAIIVFGDSLSYGHGLANPANESWPVVYSRTFRHATLHNYAIDGAGTQYVLTNEMPRYQNDTIAGISKGGSAKNAMAKGNVLVFVWIGANDIKLLVPPDTFADNLGMILDNLTGAGYKDIILMTIPDMSKLSVATEVEQGVNQFLSNVGLQPIGVKQIGQEVITRYNNVITHEAAARGLRVIDMFTFMKTIPDGLITADRVHPNAEGQKLVAKYVQDTVISFYPSDELQ